MTRYNRQFLWWFLGGLLVTTYVRSHIPAGAATFYCAGGASIITLVFLATLIGRKSRDTENKDFFIAAVHVFMATMIVLYVYPLLH